MKKLPVAGPTYDYKLENIRNDIIEQELALCLKKRENVYLDEDVQVKYTDASGTEHTFGQVTADTVSLQTDITTLQSNFTTLDGEVTANASAVSGLETRVTSAEGSITASSTSITALQSDLTTLDGEVTANASAVSSLDTRVTTAEGNITSQASSITTLQSDLSALDTDVTANASAVSSLQTTVSVIDGEVTAISSDVTSLTTTVGDNTTDITTNASSINGIEGKYAVKINNNGHVSGFGLVSTANNATPTSTFTVTADAFKIVDTSGAATPAAPFSVYTSSRVVDGETVPAGVYMDNAFITSAQIKTLDADTITAGTIDADRLNIDGVTIDTDASGNLIVGNNSIGDNQIDEITATKITAGELSVDLLPGLTFIEVNSGTYSDSSLNSLDSLHSTETSTTIRSAVGIASAQILNKFTQSASITVAAGSTIVGTATFPVTKRANSNYYVIGTCYIVLLNGSTAVATPIGNVTSSGIGLESSGTTLMASASLAIETASAGTASIGFYFGDTSGLSSNQQRFFYLPKYSFSVMEFKK